MAHMQPSPVQPPDISVDGYDSSNTREGRKHPSRQKEPNILKALSTALAALLLVLAPLAAGAAVIAVDPTDWTGYRSSGDGDLVVNAVWAESANNGLQVAWSITYDQALGLYDYTYTFTGDGGTRMKPEVSHWILEVTQSFTAAELVDPYLTISH